MDRVDAWDLLKPFHAFEIPRRGVAGMFMKKVPPSFNLIVVKLGHELEVYACPCMGSTHCRLIFALAIVQVLPRGELRTHGGSDQKDRLLIAYEPACLPTFAAETEVPWLAIFWVVDREIKGGSWREVAVASSLDLLSHPWR